MIHYLITSTAVSRWGHLGAGKDSTYLLGSRGTTQHTEGIEAEYSLAHIQAGRARCLRVGAFFPILFSCLLCMGSAVQWLAALAPEPQAAVQVPLRTSAV